MVRKKHSRENQDVSSTSWTFLALGLIVFFLFILSVASWFLTDFSSGWSITVAIGMTVATLFFAYVLWWASRPITDATAAADDAERAIEQAESVVDEAYKTLGIDKPAEE